MKIYKSKFASQINAGKVSNEISFSCRLIDEEHAAVATRAAFGWKQYHNINDIYDWLDQMQRRFPELTNYNIGKTYEKRTIRAVKLSRKPERVITTEIMRGWIEVIK